MSVEKCNSSEILMQLSLGTHNMLIYIQPTNSKHVNKLIYLKKTFKFLLVTRKKIDEAEKTTYIKGVHVKTCRPFKYSLHLLLTASIQVMMPARHLFKKWSV